MPDPGEGLVEADIVTWRVAVGDTVKINDIVVEIETSKSLVELPIPYAGVVSELLVEEGQTVDVGTPIITIDDGSDEPGPSTSGAEAAAVAAPTKPEEIEAGKIGGAAPGGRVAVLVGYGPKTTEAKRRPRKGDSPDPAPASANAGVADTFSTQAPVSRPAGDRTPLPGHQSEPVGEPLPGPGSGPAEPAVDGGAVLAKPPVRKLAKDLGVDLESVAGTGPGGVITREDVEAAAQPSGVVQPQVEATPQAGALETRIPIKGVRKLTAEAMVASAFTAPHVTEWLTVDVTATMELIGRLKARPEFAGVRVSPLLLVAKAVCLALGRTPELNASWDGAVNEIVIKHRVNLGIAAATPRGLLVPNIKDAGTLGLLDLARAISELVTVAKEGRTQPADTANGTFTITNVGVFGVDAGTPILNPPEAGILCLGAIDRRPWVVGEGAQERIEPRWLTTLSLSFDHRIVDGEHGSVFLADVASVLRDPGLAMLF
ncbi:MAG TPA: dihydrolipoamide acetyltransferase family protein [Propionibacteriaceae bacterium]|nr:dihydrolipoamide acetyltransferase family protein [Propionibacteriaceae bacterium]